MPRNLCTSGRGQGVRFGQNRLPPDVFIINIVRLLYKEFLFSRGPGKPGELLGLTFFQVSDK